MAQQLADAICLPGADADSFFLFLCLVQQDGHLVGTVHLGGLNLYAGVWRAPADELLIAAGSVAAQAFDTAFVSLLRCVKPELATILER